MLVSFQGRSVIQHQAAAVQARHAGHDLAAAGALLGAEIDVVVDQRAGGVEHLQLALAAGAAAAQRGGVDLVQLECLQQRQVARHGEALAAALELDLDTLDVVATALEELGASGRMVGVVSHVRELAERLPVRFAVRKGPTASTVVRVDA